MALTFYKCDICGEVIIEAFDTGHTPVCCGKPMRPLEAGTTDAVLEKHVPDCTVEGNTVKVQVGSVAHPMTPEHFITLIALETEKLYQVATLDPDHDPVATFAVAEGDKAVRVYEYCNLHGLWKKELLPSAEY